MDNVFSILHYFYPSKLQLNILAIQCFQCFQTFQMFQHSNIPNPMFPKMFSNEAVLVRLALISLPFTYLIFMAIFPEYGIYIVEQYGSGPFNRAMLMNIGAAEDMKNTITLVSSSMMLICYQKTVEIFTGNL